MHDDLQEQFRSKIKILNEYAWERKVSEPKLDLWLDNFSFPGRDSQRDHLHALHLLSQFMYFGNRELRSLLRVLFRELFRYPIVQRLRESNGDLTDTHQIMELFEKELMQTKFLGVGNPSESGVHLLYYFRQETELDKNLFIHTHNIFRRSTRPASEEKESEVIVSLRDPSIKHYVFLDDLCGSGTQAKLYSRDLLEEIKSLGATASLHYYVLFATSEGLQEVRDNTMFDHCDCVFELDGSYKVFDGNRYFDPKLQGIDKTYSKGMNRVYGEQLCSEDSLGFSDGQLLVGFHHNTPDNTLPIFWSDELTRLDKRWEPVFRRYWKKDLW